MEEDHMTREEISYLEACRDDNGLGRVLSLIAIVALIAAIAARSFNLI